jgi:hypothetical protein
MSRSYKRVPGYTCGYGTVERKFEKSKANRKVRRMTGIVNGMMYKKFYNSWDICDYKFLFFSKRDWIPGGVRSFRGNWPCVEEAKKLRGAWRAWRK